MKRRSLLKATGAGIALLTVPGAALALVKEESKNLKEPMRAKDVFGRVESFFDYYDNTTISQYVSEAIEYFDLDPSKRIHFIGKKSGLVFATDFGSQFIVEDTLLTDVLFKNDVVEIAYYTEEEFGRYYSHPSLPFEVWNVKLVRNRVVRSVPK